MGRWPELDDDAGMDTDTRPLGPAAPGLGPEQPEPTRRGLGITLVVLLLALLAVGVVGELLVTTTSSREAYAGVGRLELDLRASGDVEIVATEGQGAVVERRRRGFLGIPATVTEIEQVGSRLQVRSRCRMPVVSLGCRADLVVRVPADTVVTGSNANGSFEVDDIDAELGLMTSNGSIIVNGGHAAVTLDSSNGRIEVRDSGSPRIDVATSNGDILVAAVTAPGAVRAQTSNGRIEVVLPPDAPAYAVEADTSNGHTDIGIATDPNAVAVLEARTSNGDITVRTDR